MAPFCRFLAFVVAAPVPTEPPPLPDRPPTTAEVATARAAYERLGGSFQASTLPDGHQWCRATPPVPLTSDTLAKLPDLPFRYDLVSPLDEDTTPATLAPLARLRNLRSVSARAAPPRRGRDTDFTPLVGALRVVPNLERVSLYPFLGELPLTDDAAAELASFPALRSVVGSGPITDAGLASLARCRKLEGVSLQSCSRITDVGLAHLARVPTFRHLVIQDCPRPTAAGLRPFTSDPRLTQLAIGGKGMTGDALAEVGEISTLEHLELSTSSAPVGDDGCRHLGRLPRLRYIGGHRLDPTDAGAKHLAGAASLENPTLTGGALTDAGYRELARLTGLRSLHVSKAAGLTDNGLARLATLGRLEEVGLYAATKTTDAGWRAFVAARGGGLRHLYLSESPVTDAVVAKLPTDAPWLESLGLHRCPGVTDAAADSLMKLTRLRQLDVSLTAMTKSAVDRVRDRLPDARIDGRTQPPNGR